MKRFLDVLISLTALIAVFPILILITLAIKLDSKGKVIFSQERVGRREKTFRILKFRTMYSRDPAAIDQRKEKTVSASSDPRITRVGRFLRSTSLDELPQLINILKGDMSIVGPRPIIPEQRPYVPPSYLCRFEVAPGLTGLAQVSGRRSLGWLEQLAYDREYIEKKTLLLDFRIVFETALIVLARRDIYGEPGMNWRAYANHLDGRDPCDEDVPNITRVKKGL